MEVQVKNPKHETHHPEVSCSAGPRPPTHHHPSCQLITWAAGPCWARANTMLQIPPPVPGHHRACSTKCILWQPPQFKLLQCSEDQPPHILLCGKASLANLMIESTFADLHMCLNEHYKTYIKVRIIANNKYSYFSMLRNYLPGSLYYVSQAQLCET